MQLLLPSAPPLMVLLLEDMLLIAVLSSDVENSGEFIRGC